MFNITISEKTYQLIKADVTKLFERYVTIEDEISESEQAVLQTMTPPVAIPIPVLPKEPTPTNDGVTPTQVEEKVGYAVDITGAPWNPELHSAAKTLAESGKWRAKRVVGKKEKVITPTATMVSAAAPAIQPVQTPVFALPVAAPQPVVAPMPVVVAPVVAPLPTAGPQLQAHTPESFKANLVPIFAALMNEGKINQGYINTLKDYFKVGEIWQIMSDAQKVLELYENFCGAGLIVRVV